MLFIDFYSTTEVEGNSQSISRLKVKNCVNFSWWSYLNFGVCVRAFWCIFSREAFGLFPVLFYCFFWKFPCEIAWPSILLMAAPWFALILVSSIHI